MAVKLILLDLDGTLLTSDKAISPANYAALERCSSAGIHIVPSTGRFYQGMPQVVRELPFIRYVVAVNGAQVCDVREGQVLCREEISPADALCVYDLLDTLPVIYDCFLDGWGYMDEKMYGRIDEFIFDPGVNRMVKDLRRPVRNLKRFVAQKNQPLQKIQMFFRDMDRRAAELERLPRLFPNMAVSSSIANNIELNAEKASKGEALKFLCRYLGLDASETMAFGDNSNDLSMIKAAGIGVAMANADPLLLAAADWVTDTNDNDGVAKAIVRLCPELGGLKGKENLDAPVQG